MSKKMPPATGLLFDIDVRRLDELGKKLKEMTQEQKQHEIMNKAAMKVAENAGLTQDHSLHSGTYSLSIDAKKGIGSIGEFKGAIASGAHMPQQVIAESYEHWLEKTQSARVVALEEASELCKTLMIHTPQTATSGAWGEEVVHTAKTFADFLISNKVP